MRRISTRTHAILDYLTVADLFAVPRLLACGERLKRIMTGAAITKLAYTLLTRHEGGVVKALPMKAHLAMDALGGASLCAAPFTAEEDNAGAALACIAIGAFDVLVAPMTQTRCACEKRPAQIAGEEQFAPHPEFVTASAQVEETPESRTPAGENI